MKLLIVEDEPPTAAYLLRGLSEEGYAVDVARSADEADGAVSVYDYDMIVLDVMLPGRDGFTLCRTWRSAGLIMPILFLTARDDVRDRVRGLDAGGDDYLVKPFAFEELLARVRALIRRAGDTHASAVLTFGDITIDTAKRSAFRGGKPIPLTAREFQLLEYLAYNAGRVISRTALWEHVWASETEPDSNVVDVYIGYIRNKVGRDRAIIETVRGMGYIIYETDHSDE